MSGEHFTYFSNGKKADSKNPYGVIGRPKIRPPGLSEGGYLPPAQRRVSPPTSDVYHDKDGYSKRDPSSSFKGSHQMHSRSQNDFMEAPSKRDPGTSYIPPAQRQDPHYFSSPPKDHFERRKRDPGFYQPPAQRLMPGRPSPKRDPAPRHMQDRPLPRRDPSSRYMSGGTPEKSPSPGYVPPAQRQEQMDSRRLKRDSGGYSPAGYSRRNHSPDNSPTPSIPASSTTRSIHAFSMKSAPSVNSQYSTNFPGGLSDATIDTEIKSQKQEELITKLQKQISSLNRRINAHEQREKDAQSEIKRIKNQAKLKSQELAKKTKMYTDLKFTRDNSSTEAHDLQSKLEESEKKLKRLRSENQNLLTNSRKVKGDLKKMKGIHRKELYEKDEEVNQLQKELSQLQKNLVQAQDIQELERKAYRKEIEKEQRKVDENEHVQKELLARCNMQSEQLEVAQRQLAENRKVMNSQRMQLQMLDDTAIRLKQKEQEILALRSEINKPRIDFKHDLHLKKKDEEIDKLRSQLNSRNDFSKQFRVQIINKQQEIELLTEEKLQFEETLADYEEKVSLLEEKILQMQEKKSGPPAELVFQEEMVDLMLQLKEKDLELQEMKSNLQSVNSNAEKIRNYEKAFQHVQAEIQKLELSRQQFQKEIAIQKQEIKDQKLLIMQQVEEKKHLNANLLALNQEKGKYLKLLETLQDESGDVNESLVLERDMLRKDLQSERGKQEAHRSQLEASRTENEELRFELSKLAELKSHLAKVSKERTKVQEELRQAKTDLATTREQAKILENDFAEELQSKQRDIHTQKAVIEELQRRVESDKGLSDLPPTPTAASHNSHQQDVTLLKQIIAEQETTIENLLVDQAASGGAGGVTSDDDTVEKYEAQLAEYEIKAMEMENLIEELQKAAQSKPSGHSNENNRYETQIAALEERIEVMQRMQTSGTSSSHTQEARISQLEAENMEHLELVAEFEEKITSLQEALEAYKGDGKDMIPQSRYKADINEYQAEILEFQQIVEQFQKREKRFVAESKKYQQKIDMMEQVLEAQKTESFEEMKRRYEAEIVKLKNELKLAPMSEGTIERLTGESEDLKRTVVEQRRSIDTLQRTLVDMRNDAAHKDRLAEGFHKKAIKAMKENKEFSQTLKSYRDELEDKASTITELVEQTRSLITSEAAARNMNQKLEELLVESSRVNKEAFADLKISFAV